MEPIPVEAKEPAKARVHSPTSSLRSSSGVSSPRSFFGGGSGRNSPRNSPRASSKNSSPRNSPGRKLSLSRGSKSDVSAEDRLPSPESGSDSPRFGLKTVFSKFSPIVRRKQRTESFVDTIRVAKLDDFELVKELASGFIGRVYLARHKASAEYFALKVMSQEGIIAQRQLERVFNEKKIHLLLSSKNAYQVVKIYNTFRDESNIYLILEYQPADLFSLLNQMRGHVMPEQDAKFLTAVLVTALESMHELGCVYRDLKPQNVLIDDVGYPMLTDFGFSKILSLKGAEMPGLPPQTISFVGTPAYMAPELLKRKYYSEAVDWWALGILLYEVLLGDVPFDDHGGNYDKLLRGINQGLVFPPDFPPVARDFIERLLASTPEERLGGNGVEEVKSHEWLAKMDWKGIRDKKIASPLSQWIPKKSATPDTRNFDLYSLYEKSPSQTTSPNVSPRVREEMFSGWDAY